VTRARRHPSTSIDDIRRFAVRRNAALLTLEQAIDQLGFVQADPIRAPARAQDLTLRHRVAGYRAGDLERAYATLGVEEDVFINYGFVTSSLHATMHPRTGAGLSPSAANKRARDVLAFVSERGTVHPREVDTHFSPGTVTNYWGGSSSATTHLLEAMHYKGLLRVARRAGGIRIYAIQAQRVAPAGARERRARLDALVDTVVRTYAPLSASGLSLVVRRLRYAVPQWRRELARALDRARLRLSRTTIGAETWYWPVDEPLSAAAASDEVRLLAPFDPLVWDRRRFEQLWGWAYRFEAYTPQAKRKLGYYALPLLWRDRVIGWANVSMSGDRLDASVGYVPGRAPRDRAFRNALDAELTRMRTFLGLTSR
jgi:uncharacterized protein YcaQ